MKISQTRQRLLSSSIIGGLTFAALLVPAYAQTPPPPASDSTAPTAGAQPNGEEEVVVTGTRIKQPNLTSVSPLTVQTSQDIKLQGTTDVVTLLNNLPQAAVGVDGQTGGVSNGASGTATVDLRGIGVTRTLVLIDGKRLMPGDPIVPVPDLNNIPASLVDRVDIVTGGASAVYGSDAVAGVVNFIMKRDFEGVRLDAEYTFSNHTNDNNYYRNLQGQQGGSFFPQAPDGNNTFILGKDVTLSVGTNTADGKGNITAYVGYRQQKAVTQSQFDVSACSIAPTYSGTSFSYTYDARFCAGSSNSAYGRFDIVNGADGSSTSRLHVNPDGSPTFTTKGVPAYNYGPVSYFQRPDERYTAGYFAHYKVDPSIEIYSDFMFTDDHTVAQIAPSGLFAGTGSNGNSYYQINCNNPLLSAQEATALCGPAVTDPATGVVTGAGTNSIADAVIGYRFAGLPRQDDLRHTQYKIDIGMRGDIGDAWSYDVYGQYGTSIFNEHYNNDVSVSRVQNALLVDPTTGKCENDTGNCVPLNIFQFGALTPDMLNYVATPGFKSGNTEEEIVSGSITGDLGTYGIKSPWATNGASVALGMEYRRESLSLLTDSEFSSGDLSGQGGPAIGVNGAFDVYEYFGELRVPIIEDAPFAKLLAVDLGYRYSDYSLAGTASTYKIDAEWAPIDDIRFRAGYNRAVRAPNILELFTPQAVGLFSGSDPCAGTNPTASLATCQLTGVTAAQYGTGQIGACPAAQCSALFGGNISLKPEVADTYTVGAVFTPTFLRGFTASIDYFSIKVKDYINVNPTATVAACAAGNVAACSLFHRDPGTGDLFGSQGYVVALAENTGGLETKGVDFTAGYKANFDDYGLSGWGSLSFSFIGTYTDKLEFTPVIGGDSYDCVGLYGPTCGAPVPTWRHTLRVTYSPVDLPLTVSVLWRHLGDSNLESNTDNSLLANHPSGITDLVDEHIGVYDYFDLAATYTFQDRYTLRVGVNNVFDRDPPGLDSNDLPVSGPPTGNGNTFPGTYDVYGRVLFVGITADF